MRKIISFVLILLLCSCLVSCSDKTNVGAIEVVVSKDYGKVIEFAKTEFTNIFKDYENVHIEETSTMARTDGEETDMIVCGTVIVVCMIILICYLYTFRRKKK